MELLPHFLLASLLVSSVALSQNASPAQLYWKAKLPHTSIPKAIQNFLPETDHLAQGGDHFFKASGGVFHSRSIDYLHPAFKETLAEARKADIYFFNHQLKPGSKLKMQFFIATSEARLLSEKVSKTMPVSSQDFPQVLTRLSINPNTTAAWQMKQTISDYETSAWAGTQALASSLEQLVDFSIENLGSSRIEAKSTEVQMEDRSVQEYTVQEGVERILGNRTVACHTKDFAYPVFVCHAATTRRIYKLPLVGANGSKANAVVVCHTNTAPWDHNNIAFQRLNVKPGSAVPVCHFLPEDHVIFGKYD